MQETVLQRIISKTRKCFSFFVRTYVWFKFLCFFHKTGSSDKDGLDNLRENFPDAPEGWLAKIAEAGKVTWIGADLKKDGRNLSDFHYTRTVNKDQIYNPKEKVAESSETKTPSKGNYKSPVVHVANTRYLKKTVFSQTEERSVPRLKNPLAVADTVRTEKADKVVPCNRKIAMVKRCLKIDSSKIGRRKDKPENVQYKYNPLVYNRTNLNKTPSFNEYVRKESLANDASFTINVKKLPEIENDVNEENGFIKEKKIPSTTWPSLKDKTESVFCELNLEKENGWKGTEAEKWSERVQQKEKVSTPRFPEILDDNLNPCSQRDIDRWPSLYITDDNISEADFKDDIRDEKRNVWNV